MDGLRFELHWGRDLLDKHGTWAVCWGEGEEVKEPGRDVDYPPPLVPRIKKR
jgi:hypothetical protein